MTDGDFVCRTGLDLFSCFTGWDIGAGGSSNLAGFDCCACEPFAGCNVCEVEPGEEGLASLDDCLGADLVEIGDVVEETGDE